jgi:hypothetical protein
MPEAWTLGTYVARAPGAPRVGSRARCAVPARRRRAALLLGLSVALAACTPQTINTAAPQQGSSSGGPGGPGPSGGPGPGSGQVCRIATLGFAGQWGQGNVFTDWLQTKSSQGTTSIADAVLTADLLAPYQVIVVQDVRAGSPGQAGVGMGIGRTYSAAEIEVLRGWVAQGGGLMTLIGYADASEITNVNALLQPFGLSYGSNGILFGGGGNTAPVTHFTDHPIAAGVTRIGVDNGYPVLGGGTVVAFEPNPGQSDVGRALDAGNGHVFAWGDEWITYNSEWTTHPDYQVARFWANAFTWLTRSYGCQVPLPPGVEW